MAGQQSERHKRAFLNALYALPAKKRIHVVRLLAEHPDENEWRANVVVALKILYGQPKVVTEPLKASATGKEKLRKHREHVAANIKKLRNAKGMTQSDLAEAAGLHQTHVSRLETATHAATYLTIQRIATALGADPGEIDPSFE